jgi:hypothetical protein
MSEGEVQSCGRRMGEPGPWETQEGLDRWRIKANGDRTCSFCGSLHPEDFAAIAEAYAKGEPGVHFDTTTKSYKRYASRAGVQNASHGGIKFYAAHVPASGELRDRVLAADAAARVIWREKMTGMLAPAPASASQ